MTYALLITLGAGLFFIVGTLINYYSKNKKKTYYFSIGMAAVIIAGLITFDLVPEFYENVENYSALKQIGVMAFSLLIGFVILKLIDLLVPHHHHNHEHGDESKSEHKNNLLHMGIVTSLALILHNIIEGSAIYLTSLTDIKMGLLMALGVGLHNIPLGMEISSSLKLSTKKSIIPVIVMSTSTIIGALLIVIFKIDISNSLLAVLIGITIGMLLYILLCELLKEVKQNFNESSTKWGIMVGLFIIIVSILI